VEDLPGIDAGRFQKAALRERYARLYL